MPKASKPHKEYLEEWEKAMAQGLLGGRPFSQDTINAYSLYAGLFLDKYGEITVQNCRELSGIGSSASDS